MLVAAIATLVPKPAEAHFGNYSGNPCINCHSLEAGGTFYVAVDGFDESADDMTVSASPGQTLEIDYYFQGVRGASDTTVGVLWQVPALPSVWNVQAGTANAKTLSGPGWDNSWDGLGLLTQCTGDTSYYVIDYSSAGAYIGGTGTALDSGAETDATGDKHGADFRVTVPVGASGSYTITLIGVGHNGNQRKAKSVTLTVNVAGGGDSTAPDVVSDLATGTVTSSSVQLSWTAPGDDGATGTATSYDIRYSTAGAINDGNWASATQATGEPAPQAGGTPESWTVTGLNASQQYWFAIRTSDEVPNTALTSNSPTATTSAAADVTAPDPVSDLATGTVTSSSIQLSWTAPGDDGATGTATTYDIRYSTAGAINAGNWASATQATGEPAPQAGGTPESWTVTGLNPSQQYWFAIQTSDEVPNTSSVSNSPTATTSAGADVTAPDPVSDLATGTVTSSSIQLTWTAPGDDGATGTATTYDIRYSTVGAINAGNWASATQATGEPAPQAGGTPESWTVNGLNSSQQYWFAIQTSDEVPNTSSVSNSPTGTTSAGAINTTSAGTVSATPGNTVIDITAPYSDDDNGNNTVTFEIDVQGGTWSGPDYQTSTPAHGASPYTHQFTGLTNGQPYQVRVTYNDGDGVTGTSPQTISNLTPIATNPLLHNYVNTGSSKWSGDGGWGISGTRYGEFTCDTCHTKSTTNIKRVKTSVVSPNSPTHNFPGSAVTFLDATDTTSDFGDDSTTHASSTKICEVCHTYDLTQANGVKQHAYNMPVTATHYNNRDCTACHKHNQGFKANSDCDGCHGYPPDSADGFGYQAVEGKGAHLKHVTHLETISGLTRNATGDSFGDATVTALCGVCHDMNGATHETGGGTRNINFNGSATYQFGASAPAYNGVQGDPSSTTPKNCSNVSCHFKTTPVWE